MAKSGRKPVDVQALIFWEWHWWTLLSRVRAGVSGQPEVDAGWQLPQDFEFRKAPANLTHPGTIYEFDRNERRRMVAAFKPVTRKFSSIAGEPRVWEALKRAIAEKSPRSLRKALSESLYFNPPYKIPVEIWKSGKIRGPIQVIDENSKEVTLRLGAARSHGQLLYEHAGEVVDACADSRYPRKASNRDDERMVYVARVMAGVSYRVSPATAVDKLRKLKHRKVRSCNCADCTSIKRDLVQWLLSDLYDRRESLPHGAVARLDHVCDCTHCSLTATESGTRRRNKTGHRL